MKDEPEVRVVCHTKSSLAPVSYTHLDVYKRQGRGQYGHCKVKFEPMDANGEELYKFESTAVSYTHLDVYKRQVLESVCTFCCSVTRWFSDKNETAASAITATVSMPITI